MGAVNNLADRIFNQYYKIGGKMVGRASGARGLIPKSTGGRVGLGVGAAAAAYGVNNVRKYRKQDLMNDGKGPYPNGYGNE